MNLQEALKIRTVVPCEELRIARHFARVWKLAAKDGRARIAELEECEKMRVEMAREEKILC